MGLGDSLLLLALNRRAGRFEEILWLRAAARSGVLEALEHEEQAPAELARALGGPADLAEAFLAAGAACGWLRSTAGRYRLTRRAARLASHAALRAFVLYEAEVRGRGLRLLADALRGVERPGLDPEAHTLIAEVSSLARPYALKALSRVPGLDRYGARILDVGCGTGEYLSSLCGRLPRAQGLGIDLDPAVVSLAVEKMQRQGFAGRVQIRVGDIRADPLDPPYTLILANHILHYLPEEGRGRLITRLASLLEPGGHLAVQQIVRGTGKPCRSLAFFDLFLSAHSGMSRLPAAGDVRSLLRSAGLEPLPPRRLIRPGTLFYFIARRP
jgi:SAM-dependent methyltransferase